MNHRPTYFTDQQVSQYSGKMTEAIGTYAGHKEGTIRLFFRVLSNTRPDCAPYVGGSGFDGITLLGYTFGNIKQNGYIRYDFHDGDGYKTNYCDAIKTGTMVQEKVFLPAEFCKDCENKHCDFAGLQDTLVILAKQLNPVRYASLLRKMAKDYCKEESYLRWIISNEDYPLKRCVASSKWEKLLKNKKQR